MLAQAPCLPTSSSPAVVVERCGFLRDCQPSDGGVMNLLSLRGVTQLRG